jgi:AcrR family transcriptional regulator
MEIDKTGEQLPKKKQLLLAAAQELFFKYGVRRVTVEEICRTAGVSKMTCYKYFTDKWDIARAMLDGIVGQGMATFHDMMAEDGAFPAKVEKMLMQTTSQIHSVGQTFLEDMMQEDSPLHDYFREMQKKTHELSMNFFAQAQQQGHIHGDVKMPVLMFMLDHLSDLLNHPDFVQIMPDIQQRASELAAFLFYGFARKPD